MPASFLATSLSQDPSSSACAKSSMSAMQRNRLESIQRRAKLFPAVTITHPGSRASVDFDKIVFPADLSSSPLYSRPSPVLPQALQSFSQPKLILQNRTIQKLIFSRILGLNSSRLSFSHNFTFNFLAFIQPLMGC